MAMKPRAFGTPAGGSTSLTHHCGLSGLGQHLSFSPQRSPFIHCCGGQARFTGWTWRWVCWAGMLPRASCPRKCQTLLPSMPCGSRTEEQGWVGLGGSQLSLLESELSHAGIFKGPELRTGSSPIPSTCELGWAHLSKTHHSLPGEPPSSLLPVRHLGPTSPSAPNKCSFLLFPRSAQSLPPGSSHMLLSLLLGSPSSFVCPNSAHPSELQLRFSSSRTSF